MPCDALQWDLLGLSREMRTSDLRPPAFAAVEGAVIAGSRDPADAAAAVVVVVVAVAVAVVAELGPLLVLAALVVAWLGHEPASFVVDEGSSERSVHFLQD